MSTDSIPETRSPDYYLVLRILADVDYNDGAGMRWFPSGKPTEQAEKVAARIVRELKATS